MRSRPDAILALWEELGTKVQRSVSRSTSTRKPCVAATSGRCALMLERALSGSAVHVAAYREARVAYLPKALDGEQRAQMFAARLIGEAARMAQLLGHRVTTSDPGRARRAARATHAGARGR